jgi:UrcA family protein
MSRFITRLATVASLVLAVAPVASIASSAHAQGAERVRVADLNMASASGKAAFAQRVDHAARHFCAGEHNLTMRSACQSAVRSEANEKIAADSQFASRI